uniref:G_PROTEIN_RECEP_F1_2 domain-containing protein n=1 Tax=Caenorhabditis tropicalis TaxID=1561998 RepID=A0A1I7TYP6_9PELO
MTIRIILHGVDLFNYFGPWISGCEIFPSRTRCELRLIYKLSAFVIEVTPFILTAERFAATFQFRHYENRYKWFGVLLIFLHVFLGILFVWVQKSEASGDVIVYYCWLSSTGNRYMVSIPIYFVVSSQFITIPTLLYLLKKNERYRETSLSKCATLTQRYQIFENLRTLNMFRIMSVLTWLYVTYNAVASFFIRFFLKDMPLPNQFASMEIVHCIPFYYIILSILIFREDRKPGIRYTIKVDTYQPHYFDGLQKFFDEAYNRVNATPIRT